MCGKQVANAVISQAGARNVFAGCDGDFKPVSWEDVVAKDPDWIQLGVRNRGDAAATRTKPWFISGVPRWRCGLVY